jgi:aminoglycoside phosphotransferase family enzyme/predicted kinase
MTLEALISLLSLPSSYAEQADDLHVIHTHISVVFLTNKHAYKIKKPVSLAFVDFSTLARRRHYCEEEVRLNRRLAPDVYLGVVPVTAAGMEGTGEPLEWAVKMRRLPDDATLQKQLQQGCLDRPVFHRLAQRLAQFHLQAARGPHIARFGTFEVVAGNARDNFVQSQYAVGSAVSASVFERLRQRTDEVLDSLKSTIGDRAARGVPCDTHGDLHLDHIYCFPDSPPPGDLVIVDCIEFNEQFRYADPIADAAFVEMDLKYHGRWDLARFFRLAYLQATGESEGETQRLLPFYRAYRAIIRAKVESMKAAEPEVPADERKRALAGARAHWLLALTEIDLPSTRPCLVLVGGLPGSGKSTLAYALCADSKRQLLQTDRIRKELAAPLTGEALYTPQWNDRTYGECLMRAEELLWNGQPVVVDANFREDSKRRMFMEAAQRMGVPALLLLCKADDEAARQRLAQRHGDISDADWAVRQRVAELWEDLSSVSRRHAVELIPDAKPDALLEEARQAIAALFS